MVLSAIDLCKEVDSLEVAASCKVCLTVLLMDPRNVSEIDEDIGICLTKGHEHQMQALIEQPQGKLLRHSHAV